MVIIKPSAIFTNVITLKPISIHPDEVTYFYSKDFWTEIHTVNNVYAVKEKFNIVKRLLDETKKMSK
jgi:hypothetical protein